MNTEFVYFPPSPEVTSAWGVEATCVGYLDTDDRDQYPPQDHPPQYSLSWDAGRVLEEFQIHFILRGEGLLELEQKEKSYRIRSGSVFLLHPGVWHRYIPSTSSGWHEFWLGLKGEAAQRILDLYLREQLSPILAPADDSVMLRLFDSAIAGLGGGMDRAALSASTAMLGLSMLPQLSAAPLDTRPDIVRTACRMLETNLDEDISLEDVAAKLGVGYHSLRKKFTEQTGVSLHQYRLTQRLARAKILLLSQQLSIESVAERVGFRDPLYFSRFFKAREGVAPSDYLRAHRRNNGR